MKDTIKTIAVSSVLASLIAASFVWHSHAAETKNMQVFKTPWCGCCKVWTQAMQKAGFTVEVFDMKDLTLIKRQAGVPKQIEACHTAVIENYVLEGHVPLQAIEKLRREKPAIRGIGVAGMPTGSLGMGYEPDAQYDVMSFTYSKSDKPVLFYQAGR